jgi:hypothetical protein
MSEDARQDKRDRENEVPTHHSKRDPGSSSEKRHPWWIIGTQDWPPEMGFCSVLPASPSADKVPRRPGRAHMGGDAGHLSAAYMMPAYE